jgi:L-fuculose-phosphate aldolase
MTSCVLCGSKLRLCVFAVKKFCVILCLLWFKKISMENNNFKLMHPKDQIILIINRIYRKGLTTTSGGNLSIIDEEGKIWITPSAIDKGSLSPRDIMCLHPDGSIEGPHKPSSELPFHKAIYDIRPDIKAVVHAHPPALVSFSIVRKVPDTRIIPQAQKVCGAIGYAPYSLPGSKQLGSAIAAEFAKGFNSVIMENHGTVVGGSDLIEAYERFEAMEFCGRTLINSKALGEPKFLDDEQLAAFEAQIPQDVPELENVIATSDEKEIRTDLVRTVRRACDQGLMMSTYGTASVRWRDNDFLITKTQVTRWNIGLDDIVQIRGGMREPGKIPSRSMRLHYDIYRKNPHVNAIISTQPPYLMAFGATHIHLDVKTIPESWIFLQDMPNLPFGSQFAGKTDIPDLINQKVAAVLINNDAVVVTGKSLLQAFDRLEVAEFSAKSLCMGKAIGEFYPIGDEEIEELKKAFF